MPKVHFVLADGSHKTIDVPKGDSIMQAALQAVVPGIIAECGGSAMCGTCHVYVDPAYVARLRPIDRVEEEILDSGLIARQNSSRLSCQIPLDDDLDGIVVHVPGS